VPALLAALVRPGRAGRVPPSRLVAAVRVYQRTVSGRRPAVCRFTPSCSAYAAEALTRHGTARGIRLALGRLLRCRPGGRRGADPVPA
jgi:putative membrane protein insertion efficiency factor